MPPYPTTTIGAQPLRTAPPAAGDLFPVESPAGATGRIPWSQLLAGIPAGTLPLTTDGDLLTRAAGVLARIALGAAGQVLLSSGTEAAWGWPAIGVSTSATEPTGPEVGPGYMWMPDGALFLIRNRANDGWMEISWTPYTPAPSGDIIGTPEGDQIGTPEGDQIGAV